MDEWKPLVLPGEDQHARVRCGGVHRLQRRRHGQPVARAEHQCTRRINVHAVQLAP